jgi:hypothetical protein
MKKDKIPVIQEKLQYLLTQSFKENRFDVLRIDVEIDEYTEKDNGDLEIISYDVYPKVDYQGPLDGWEPWHFRNDLGKMFEHAFMAASSFSIEQDGRVVRGSENVYIGEPSVISMNYKVEDQHEFLLSFKITYPD